MGVQGESSGAEPPNEAAAGVPPPDQEASESPAAATPERPSAADDSGAAPSDQQAPRSGSSNEPAQTDPAGASAAGETAQTPEQTSSETGAHPASDSGRHHASAGSGRQRVSTGSGRRRASGGSGRQRASGGSGRQRASGGSGRQRGPGGSGRHRASGGSGRQRPSGGRRGGRGSRPEPAQKPLKNAHLSIESKEVKELAKVEGLSLEAALAVLQELTTLDKARQNQRSRVALNKVAREHNLPHSLAGQVLKEQLTVEEAITRSHVLQYRRRHYDDDSFEEWRESGEARIVARHGLKVETARLVENLKYDVKLRLGDEEVVLPKHTIKYHHGRDVRKPVQKLIKAERGAAPTEPITKVTRRFKIRDDELQRVMDLKSHLNVSLLEGEKFAAELIGYTRYELHFRVGDEGRLVVFRHALEHAEAVPLEEVLAAERYAKKMAKKKAGRGGKKKKKKR